MAFNGTKNLPESSSSSIWETVGVKFGYNLNAGTSWDYTVYNISDADLASGNHRLRNARPARLVALHRAAARRDRLRARRHHGGAPHARRRLVALDDEAPAGSRQGNPLRAPQPDRLSRRSEELEHDALERFYHKWYRPDHQAIIIVGDLDAEATGSPSEGDDGRHSRTGRRCPAEGGHRGARQRGSPSSASSPTPKCRVLAYRSSSSARHCPRR